VLDLQLAVSHDFWSVEGWGNCMVADCAYSFDKKDRFPGTKIVNFYDQKYRWA
jgi:hypothetical protein